MLDPIAKGSRASRLGALRIIGRLEALPKDEGTMALTEQSQEAVKNSLEVLTTPPGLPPLSKEQHELLELVLENLAYSAENAGLRFAFGKEK